MTFLSHIIFAITFIALTAATKLTIYPQQVVKDQPVTFVCEPEPPSSDVTYKWLHNGNRIGNLVSSNWTIKRASLSTRSNFSCIVQTKTGSISRADIFVDVTAPPRFIKDLLTYYGYSHTSTNVSLTCIIECYPLCNVLWYKDDQKIDTDNPLYYIKNEQIPVDDPSDEFESVESTLVWNLKNWPNQRLIKNDGQSKYTCKSGDGFLDVESTAYVAVEYPPENITLSTKAVVNVIENGTADPVTCTANGNPKVEYVWKYTPTGVVQERGNTLRLGKITRDQEHSYTCEASNRQGTITTELHFNVLYKPIVRVFSNKTTFVEGSSETAFIFCKYYAEPARPVTVSWLKNGAVLRRIEGKHIFETLGTVSLIIRDVGNRDAGDYRCVLSNSVGKSTSRSISLAVVGSSYRPGRYRLSPRGGTTRNPKKERQVF